MAFPQVQSLTQTSFSSSTTSHLVNMPALVNSGDCLLMIFSNYGTSTVTTPSGWTLKWETGISGLGTGECFIKVADGSEGETTVDVVTSIARTGAVQVYRIDSWFGSLSGLEVGIVALAGGGATPNPPSLTASWGAEDNLWIATTQHVDDNVNITSYPSGYGFGSQSKSNSGSNNSTVVGSARKENNTATEDPGNFSIISSEASAANTIVIRPEGAPTGYANKVLGIIGGKVNGIDSANIAKVNGV